MTATIPTINLVSMIHLIFLSLWGGVVSAESVLELYPWRRRDLLRHTVEFHYWIDLLVELPLVGLVVASGLILSALAWPLDAAHFFKIGCAAVAIGANLVCVYLVIVRRRLMKAGATAEALWSKSRQVDLCAVIGMPFAAVAAGMGFWLAYHRLLELLT